MGFKNLVVAVEPSSDCKPIKWTATAEEIIDKVRAVTARMEALLRATEIDDVGRQAA